VALLTVLVPLTGIELVTFALRMRSSMYIEVFFFMSTTRIYSFILAGLEESSSSARISRYESGVHEPPLSFAESSAKVSAVPAAYFYCSDDRLAEIILHCADMSEAQRRELQAKAGELAGY
jgi:transcriptional regulator with XRE-family HTH domain